MKKYYSVLVQWVDSNQWSVEFGDYDKECAQDEMEYLKEQEDVCRVKLICTSDSQDAIMAKVNELNKKGN